MAEKIDTLQTIKYASTALKRCIAVFRNVGPGNRCELQPELFERWIPQWEEIIKALEAIGILMSMSPDGGIKITGKIDADALESAIEEWDKPCIQGKMRQLVDAAKRDLARQRDPDPGTIRIIRTALEGAIGYVYGPDAVLDGPRGRALIVNCQAALSALICCQRDPAPVVVDDDHVPDHELKTDPNVFQAVKRGDKTYEIRRNDRDYKVGDILLLKETVYTGHEMTFPNYPLVYTGDQVCCRVTHILQGQYGLQDDWCILSIRLLRSALRQPPAQEAVPARMGTRELIRAVQNEVRLAGVFGIAKSEAHIEVMQSAAAATIRFLDANGYLTTPPAPAQEAVTVERLEAMRKDIEPPIAYNPPDYEGEGWNAALDAVIEMVKGGQ